MHLLERLAQDAAEHLDRVCTAAMDVGALVAAQPARGGER